VPIVFCCCKITRIISVLIKLLFHEYQSIWEKGKLTYENVKPYVGKRVVLKARFII